MWEGKGVKCLWEVVILRKVNLTKINMSEKHGSGKQNKFDLTLRFLFLSLIEDTPEELCCLLTSLPMALALRNWSLLLKMHTLLSKLGRGKRREERTQGKWHSRCILVIKIVDTDTGWPCSKYFLVLFIVSVPRWLKHANPLTQMRKQLQRLLRNCWWSWWIIYLNKKETKLKLIAWWFLLFFWVLILNSDTVDADI